MSKKNKLGKDPLKDPYGFIQDTTGGINPERKPIKVKIDYPPVTDYSRYRDKRGRKRTLPIRESTGAGLPLGWRRATFIIRDAHLVRLKKLIKLDKPLKNVIDDIFTEYFKTNKER